MNEVGFIRNLLEVFNTKQELTWEVNGDLQTTSFVLDDQEYGVTIRGDNVDSINFYEVSFTSNNPDSKSHAATNLHKNQFKILGIISNSVKSRLVGVDVVYFTAKIYTSNDDIEYQAKVKLYSRIAHKLAVELSLYETTVSLGDETIFILAKSSSLLNLAKQKI